MKVDPYEAGRIVYEAISMESRGIGSINVIPVQIIRIIKDGLWKQYFMENIEEMVENKSFVEFIEKAHPRGMNSNIKQLRGLLQQSTDRMADEALKLFEKEILQPAAKQGAPKGSQNAKKDKGIKHNNIMFNPDRQGTDKDYTVRRLERDRPDLAKKVINGELSANAAAIEAGFRTKTVTMPLEPKRAAETLKRHFTKKQIKAIIEALGG
jgi:hypothetical protein